MSVGLQCVAQCTLDSCWYRAEILDVRQNSTFMEMSLIFVDYGSSDYICDASKSVTCALMFMSSVSLYRVSQKKYMLIFISEYLHTGSHF